MQGYEPYVLAARSFVPWYDERFRGYGRDKIQHLTHLAGKGPPWPVPCSNKSVAPPPQSHPARASLRGAHQLEGLPHCPGTGLNVTFAVHPTAFVVHVPHAKAATFRATKESGQWDKVRALPIGQQAAGGMLCCGVLASSGSWQSKTCWCPGCVGNSTHPCK